MTGCWHPENGKGQTAVLEPSMEEQLKSVSEKFQLNCVDWKANIQNGKLPEGAFVYYYTHYFFYYTHYSSLLTRIAVAVSSSYALPIYVHRLCVLQQAYGTSWKLPMLSEVPILVCSYAIILHYITIISIIFSIISIIPKQKITFLVGIHSRLQANHIIQHGGSLFVASSSGIDSILDHEGAFSHNKAGIGLTILWVHTTDVCKPSGTHCRTKLIAQFIN